MVMMYTQAKVQGQRSLSSKDRVETNGQTYGCDYRTFVMVTVSKM